MGSRRSKADSEASAEQSSLVLRGKKPLVIEGYPVEGLSIGGQETCVIFPSLKLAFDIGRCPQRAISQEFLFITHGHMDHIGGLPMYVATRGLYSMKPPTIFVPVSIKEHVEKLFEVHRAMDQSELKNNLVALNVGEEFQLRNDLKVRAFKTYHVIPSQGYCIYSVKKKLKAEFCGLSGNEIKGLRLSGVEVTYTITTPEIAFTGDTMSDFVIDPDNSDVLNARILVMESTFVNDAIPTQHARDYGHTHLFEIASYENRFQNKAILLIHFSARYYPEGLTIDALTKSDKRPCLKNNLKKSSIDYPTTCDAANSTEVAEQVENETSCCAVGRKVQWTDKCGKELVEIREFELEYIFLQYYKSN